MSILERTRLFRLQVDLLQLCVEDGFVVFFLCTKAGIQAVLPDVPDVDRADVRLVDLSLDQRSDRRAVETTSFALVGWNETDERLILWTLNCRFCSFIRMEM